MTRSLAPAPLAALLIAGVLGLLSTAAPAVAQTNFSAIRSGSWTSPTTWFSPGDPLFGRTPGPADSAYVGGQYAVAASSLVFGLNANTNGGFAVVGQGTLFSAQTLTLGASGSGSMTVFGGASASWSNVYLAVSAGSSGSATFAGGSQPFAVNLDTIDFTGAGSAHLFLGVGGYAPATATSTTPELVLGGRGGSDGEIRVTAGSTLTTQALTAGGTGIGYLGVSTGGTVTATAVALGRDAGSVGQMSVQDAGSSLSAQSLAVGGTGYGNLTASGGGSVTVTTTAVVGRDAGPTASLSVSGTGSSFSAQSLTVGAAGGGNMSVYGGGTAATTTTVVGRDARPLGSQASSLTVQDAGSSFSAQSLTVGAAGSGSMTVFGGAAASWSTLALAVSAGSSGSVSLAGGSQPFAVNLDTIDFTGAGAAGLTLGAGGFAPATATSSAFPALVLGGKSGSSGTITVTSGSTLGVANDLTLGVLGTGNLSVFSGGQVTVGGAVTMAGGSGSHSTVNVSGAGSKWTVNGSAATALAVGAPGVGGVAHLNVVAGQTHLTYGGMAVNSPSQSDPSSVFVTGSGAALTLDGPFGDLRIADGSGRGQLTVMNSGFVRSTAGYIGGAAGTIGEATVTGTNSIWTVLGTGQDAILEVGRYNLARGTLTVSGGGFVQVSGQTTAGLSGGAGAIVLDGGTLKTGPAVGGSSPLIVGPTGTLAAGPAGATPSVLQLGGGTSVVAGTLDLRGNVGTTTPGSLQVEFVQPGRLNVGGQIVHTFATTNPGSVGAPPANGTSSAALGTGTGNSLLSVTGTGTLDLTGAKFSLVGGAGLAANWDPTRHYSWQVIQTAAGVTVTGLDAATVDAGQFGQSLGSGAFFLTADANGVYVAFSPVPEPGTVFGVGAAVLGAGALVRRRNRVVAKG